MYAGSSVDASHPEARPLGLHLNQFLSATEAGHCSLASSHHFLQDILVLIMVRIPILQLVRQQSGFIQGVLQHWTPENLAKSQALYKHELDTSIFSKCLIS